VARRPERRPTTTRWQVNSSSYPRLHHIHIFIISTSSSYPRLHHINVFIISTSSSYPRLHHIHVFIISTSSSPPHSLTEEPFLSSDLLLVAVSGSGDEEEEKKEVWSGGGGGGGLYVDQLMDFDAPFNCRLSLKDFDTLILDLDRELAQQSHVCL